MPAGTYRYAEVHHPDPDRFGEELPRVLNQLRDEGCEIVSVSLSLVKLGPVSGEYEESSRVAQIVAYQPARSGMSLSALKEHYPDES